MTRYDIDEARKELRRILREEISNEAMTAKLRDLAESVGAGAGSVEPDSPQLVADILDTLSKNAASAVRGNIGNLLWLIKINFVLWTAVLWGPKVFGNSGTVIVILGAVGMLFSLFVYWQCNRVRKECAG